MYFCNYSSSPINFSRTTFCCSKQLLYVGKMHIRILWNSHQMYVALATDIVCCLFSHSNSGLTFKKTNKKRQQRRDPLCSFGFIFIILVKVLFYLMLEGCCAGILTQCHDCLIKQSAAFITPWLFYSYLQ